MKLREYLFINRIHKSDFAKQLGIHYVTFLNITNGLVEPSLRQAITIVKLTNGKVTYKDLLCNGKKYQKHKEYIRKWQKKLRDKKKSQNKNQNKKNKQKSNQ